MNTVPVDDEELLGSTMRPPAMDHPSSGQYQRELALWVEAKTRDFPYPKS